ncbi:MAG TPA: tetratricopeptide repeat protein [Pirellulaceae bacterium]|nr:tetratricopeptide repeat protein [Pirellulaceae bacterium]
MAALWAQEKSAPPLFDGLGDFGRKITTTSPQAQRYFNQGLCWLYAFNHDEAIRSFHHATTLDPQAAMPWWGIAVASGPHINNPVVSTEKAKSAWTALAKAKERSAGASKIERALIEALASRYADPQPDDRKPLDEAYATAMRKVWQANPTDADVGALFAESLMDLRPWDQWQPAGKPQPGTEEVVNTLQAVLTQTPNHPLALHLYIHAVEASPHPELAAAPADRLRNLQPGLGHLVHMPSHIDVRLGHWAAAIEANRKAIEADGKYREQVPQQYFYRVYIAHNHHMLAFAAMMRGQSRLAIDEIDAMVKGIPPQWLKDNATAADGFASMPLEVLVRFGRWDEVLAAPEPPEHLPLSRALRHVSRGIAFAAKGQSDTARAEQQAFLAARKLVPGNVTFGNNKAAELMNVAEKLLAGEILWRDGKNDAAFSALREAIKLEDQLRYSEPPDWIHPVRHALGATLLAAGRAAEAEAVYREDLAKLPSNGWSLYGLAECLKQQGKLAESRELEARFREVWKDADIRITSSCYCQPGKQN